MTTKWGVRVFPGQIHKVQYEPLISDKENQVCELIRGTVLNWDEACLDSGRSDTAVRTASVWQKRQGVYTTSRERWRNYERYLSPAIGLLRTEVIFARITFFIFALFSFFSLPAFLC